MVALFAQQSNIVEFPTKSNEWYTPARYVEAAREVMGGIDLDPASCEVANRTVKATRFYTAKENGLAQEWSGRVWLNPPYSSLKSVTGLGGAKRKGPTHLFVAKLLNEFKNGDVSQAIVCINADMNRIWFQCFWDYILCFTHQSIHFYKPNSEGKAEKDSQHSHFFGSCFVYLGPHEEKFINIFSQFGTVARRVSAPKVQPVTLSLWEVQP